MNYQMSALNTIQECEELINFLNEQKSDFDYRKLVLNNRIENTEDTAEEIESEISTLSSEITYLNNRLATMAEGPEKNDVLDDLARTENDLIDLLNRRDNQGIQVFLRRQLDYNMLERQIASNTTLSASVNNRKAELAT
jgi:hypothetical protein